MMQLRQFLNPLQVQYHQSSYLSSDPLEFLHRFEDLWDQEAVGLVSALLAYGNVKQIRKSVEGCLARMSLVAPSPRVFVESLSKAAFRKKAERAFAGYVHRFNSGTDLLALFTLLGRSWAKYGSLGGHFLSYLRADDPTVENALSFLIRDWKSWSPADASRGLFYLLNSPADGSCCKRWCLFLRWMGRRDHLDPGLWTRQTGPIGARTSTSLGVVTTQSHILPYLPTHQKVFLRADQLVMPLDTHTGRICQYLGLTHKKAVNWQTALEVTANLKKVDPQDPTRYDFALSRLGILDICQRTYREEICQKCQLLTVCQFAQKFSPPLLVSTQSSV